MTNPLHRSSINTPLMPSRGGDAFLKEVITGRKNAQPSPREIVVGNDI